MVLLGIISVLRGSEGGVTRFFIGLTACPSLSVHVRAWGQANGFTEAGEATEGLELAAQGPLQLAEFVNFEAIVDALVSLLPFL